MSSINSSEFINKENVQPFSTAPPATVSNDGDSDSDNIFKVRKIRTDSPPVVKLENFSVNERLYCDLDSIYNNGVERSIEEIRYDKWLKWKKRKAEKQLIEEMVKEIDFLKRKNEANELIIGRLRDEISAVKELIPVAKTVNEDKQEVSFMVRGLINGSYNDTQIEPTLLKPLPSIPVKDFTIYKDVTVEEQCVVAPAQDNVPLIRFDVTEFVNDEHRPTSPISPSSDMVMAEIEPATQTQKDTVETEKPVLEVQEDNVENEEPKPQTNMDTIEIKEPNIQIYEDSIEIKEPNCDFLIKLATERQDPIDMEIEKTQPKIAQSKPPLAEAKRKSLLNLRENNKLSVIAENSRDSTNVTEKSSPVKMGPPVVTCESRRNVLDLADLSVNPIIHRGSMNFRFSEAFTMHIPNSEDECVPKSCSTPGKTQ